jgi:hypothetical protein
MILLKIGVLAGLIEEGKFLEHAIKRVKHCFLNTENAQMTTGSRYFIIESAFPWLG